MRAWHKAGHVYYPGRYEPGAVDALGVDRVALHAQLPANAWRCHVADAAVRLDGGEHPVGYLRIDARGRAEKGGFASVGLSAYAYEHANIPVKTCGSILKNFRGSWAWGNSLKMMVTL